MNLEENKLASSQDLTCDPRQNRINNVLLLFLFYGKVLKVENKGKAEFKNVCKWPFNALEGLYGAVIVI